VWGGKVSRKSKSQKRKKGHSDRENKEKDDDPTRHSKQHGANKWGKKEVKSSFFGNEENRKRELPARVEITTKGPEKNAEHRQGADQEPD